MKTIGRCSENPCRDVAVLRLYILDSATPEKAVGYPVKRQRSADVIQKIGKTSKF